MGSTDCVDPAPICPLEHHRTLVAFDDDPGVPRLWVASPAALLGLKSEAFGRTRHDGQPVDRDFSDVVLLLDRLADEIAEELRGPSPMRNRVTQAAERLRSDPDAANAAARGLVDTGEHDTYRDAERAVRRVAERFLRRLG